MKYNSDLELTPAVFPNGSRPLEPAGLKWACRSLYLPGLHRYATALILRSMPNCSNAHFVRGFKCMYGNVHARDVSFNDVFLQDYSPIYIGPRSGFSYQCMILTATHDLKGEFKDIISKPVVIGCDVWITSRVTILGGSTIGDHSVIGAGSVVSGDIPPGVFAAGNPARVIKKLENPVQFRG